MPACWSIMYAHSLVQPCPVCSCTCAVGSQAQLSLAPALAHLASQAPTREPGLLRSLLTTSASPPFLPTRTLALASSHSFARARSTSTSAVRASRPPRTLLCTRLCRARDAWVPTPALAPGTCLSAVPARLALPAHRRRPQRARVARARCTPFQARLHVRLAQRRAILCWALRQFVPAYGAFGVPGPDLWHQYEGFTAAERAGLPG
jgi:hypothetical protein